MNIIQASFAPQARGIEFVAAAAGLRREDLVAWGVPDVQAASIVRLYEVYFGKTRFARYQRAARQAAHSFAVLEVIERHARGLPTKEKQWQLRYRLAGLCLDARAMGRAAARVKKELCEPYKRKPGISRMRHSGGLGTVKITAEESVIADLFTLVDPSRPIESLAENLRSGRGGGFRVITHAVVALEDYAAIERGEGPTKVQLSNGATLSLREYLQRRVEDEGLATVVSERDGLVDQYRLARTANAKQRDMLKATQRRCGHKGCRRPADECQAHHVVAWARGGETNVDNLVLVCAYHNAVNDDDPSAPPRFGRVIRVGLRVGWQPPWGGSVYFDSG